MLRLVLVLTAAAFVTFPLMPVQWAAIKLNWPLRRRIPVFYHRTMCRLLGIRVRIVGVPIDARPLLIVANHSSWMDISILTSLTPVVFVAKSEIARWPLFGLLAKLQRSVFVERDRRQKTGEVNAEIARRLAEGDPVLLFGEGTAGDGNRVMPFRSALIGAARDAIAASGTSQVWVQPVSLAYVSQHGIPFGRHLRRAPPGTARRAWCRTSNGGQARRDRRRGHLGRADPLDTETDRKVLTKLLESSVRGSRSRPCAAMLRLPGRPPDAVAVPIRRKRR